MTRRPLVVRRRPEAGRLAGFSLAAATFAGATAVAIVAAGPILAAVLPAAAPDAGAAAVGAPAALPACTYADVAAPWGRLGEFRFTLLDTRYRLPASYRPPLTSAARAGLSGGARVRPEIVADLLRMRVAARSARVRLAIRSAYRSFATQRSTFAYWVRVGGLQNALLTSARPGHSEHQLGTAIDFTTPGGGAPWAYPDWGTTRAGRWLAANAWRYGFVMSYPRGATRVTCYRYEPWHFRWVGRSEAALIHGSNLAPRAWLWRHAPSLAAPSPPPTPEPSPTSTPSSPAPSDSPTPPPSASPPTSPEPSPSPDPSPRPVPSASPAASPKPSPEPSPSPATVPAPSASPVASPSPEPSAGV